MEFSGEIHAPAALLLGKGALIPFEEKAEWATETV
jgi:hypothetical protein